MDVAEIFQMVFQMGGGVAFPIVMCLILFKYIKEEQAQTRGIINELNLSIQKLIMTVSKKYEYDEREMTRDDLR